MNTSTVLITGATGHLGRAVARTFGERGWQLALFGRTVESLQAAFGDDNSHQMLVGVDLLDPAQVDAAVNAAVARFGRIDAVCNLAGSFGMGEDAHSLDTARWKQMFDTNVHTVRHIAHAVVPHFLVAGRGKVVNVGAYAAQKGVAHMGAYVAAKSALLRLTETLSAELRDHGINVNCVLPTIIDTPDNRAAMPQADPSRWVAPADLARVIAFLASEDARAIHGAGLPVTGLS